MVDQISLSGLSEESWRAVIEALAAAGWSVRNGGGLDFSWAAVERDGMRIDMEYDAWQEGEMVFAKADASIISGDLPAQLIAKLEIGSFPR
ncbi:hypothetical protein CO652_00055 [Rhizobium sp. H4]|uniref:hypothetical protein n=1 Tax=Rhizobium TaxID=379 RepID=UPI000BEA333E|nr:MULTISPECIES: hypothetical protein [Rhizobium]PDV89863.1 hypothetical protein CO652_00055 [Rhizobium sp. H4]WET72702.1 hypothetical protein PYR68_14625 [Rhizobium croatiense]